jgi:hypothetical protein
MQALQYRPHMADFEGIQLTGEGPACGCVLVLRASSAISRVVILPEALRLKSAAGCPP